MSLQALAAKLRADRLATATAATETMNKNETVAKVADVAVAVPQISKIALTSPRPSKEVSPEAVEARPATSDADGERLKQATLAFKASPFGGLAAIRALIRKSAWMYGGLSPCSPGTA
jgi:hypothetical protein